VSSGDRPVDPQGRDVDLVITGAAEILCCAPDGVGAVGAGGIAVRDGRIVAVGDTSGYRGRDTVDATGCVVMPGFVDAHTHVVFGGTRAAEYAARVAGRPVPDGAPVGIVGTMTQTRAAGREALVEQAEARIAEMLAHGTTTVESKTGYGLAPDAEAELLAVNGDLAQETPVTVVSTYLGAHAFAPDADHDRYVDQVVAQTGRVGAGGLASFCDVYCDDGYFDLDQTLRILQAGTDAGLPGRLHLDAYSHTGAADIAVELGAASADHLNFTTDAELARLAGAGVAGVYLPCLEYAVAHPAPLDPRRVRDAGMTLALATDICPGCWTTSMQLVVAMACRTGGLSVAEALTAATYGSAVSLGIAGRVGSVQVGKQADLLVLDVPSHEDIAYRLGRNNVRLVIKDGSVVVRRDEADGAPAGVAWEGNR
jgi:imidazolonepropionase